MDNFNYVKGFDLFGVKARQIPCLTAKGEPSNELALKIGLLYINEDNGDMYKCIKKNGEEGLVWVLVNNENTNSGQNIALTEKERSTLIAVVGAIGVFNVPNGQDLVSAFNAAWNCDTPDEPVAPDEPDTPDEPEQATENLFHIGETFVNAANTPEIEWEDYGCSWKSSGNWSQACTMTGLEAGKTYTMFADATINGAAPSFNAYITARVVSWAGTPDVGGFDALATFYPSPATGSWAGYAEFTVPVDAQAVGLAFVSSSTSAMNRIYNVAVYEGSMAARP